MSVCRQASRLVLGLLLGLGSCIDGGRDPPPNTPAVSPGAVQTPEALPLGAPPRRVLAVCQRVPALAKACPARIPISEGGFRFNSFDAGPYWTFTAEAGSGPHEDPERNKPPQFVHAVVQGGDVSAAFETFTFSISDPVGVRDGLMRSEERRRLAMLGRAGRTPQALFLGSVTWSDLNGELILVPSFQFVDSIHADHIMFLWKTEESGYAVSLHAWEPFAESVATLEAVVASLPT